MFIIIFFSITIYWFVLNTPTRVNLQEIIVQISLMAVVLPFEAILGICAFLDYKSIFSLFIIQFQYNCYVVIVMRQLYIFNYKLLSFFIQDLLKGLMPYLTMLCHFFPFGSLIGYVHPSPPTWFSFMSFCGFWGFNN